MHTEYERELVPLFFKVLGEYASGSELDEDAVDRVTILSHKLVPQSPEKGRLLLVEALAVRLLAIKVIPTRHLDAAIATADGFNRVRTHKRGNVIADRPLADVELAGQIVVCIMPSEAQHLQQSLAAFCRAHAFTPFPLLLTVHDKGESGKSRATSAKFFVRKFDF